MCICLHVQDRRCLDEFVCLVQQPSCVILITLSVIFFFSSELSCSRSLLPSCLIQDRRSWCLPFPAINVSFGVTHNDKVTETQGQRVRVCVCVNTQCQQYTKVQLLKINQGYVQDIVLISVTFSPKSHVSTNETRTL